MRQENIFGWVSNINSFQGTDCQLRFAEPAEEDEAEDDEKKNDKKGGDAEKNEIIPDSTLAPELQVSLTSHHIQIGC